jgi:hypothetical protein
MMVSVERWWKGTDRGIPKVLEEEPLQLELKIQPVPRSKHTKKEVS